MSEQKKSVDEWWNEMNLNQKQIVRMMLQMLGGTTEGQVLEVRRGPGRLNMAVVDRPEAKESGVEDVTADGSATG